MPKKYCARMLGAFEVVGENRVIDRFETRKTALLLALLAIEPGRARSRDDLGSLLWPGDDPEDYRPRLRQAIAALKRAFGDDGDEVVRSDRLSVSLDPTLVGSDIDDFRRALKRARSMESPSEQAEVLGAAHPASIGEFLPGFADDWAVVERGHFASQQMEFAERLVEALYRTGRIDGALEAAHRWVSLDPLRSASVQRAMAIAADEGRLVEAVRFYKIHRDRLREDLRMDASPELKAYAAGLRREARVRGLEVDDVGESEDAPKPCRQVQLPQRLTPIYGRERELEELLRISAPGSNNRLVTITGIGGVGKTRLALELAWVQSGRFEGRVWFVALANIRNHETIGGAILDALGVKRESADDSEQLVKIFGSEPHLLILDNFEQVVDGGAEFIHGLLGGTPAVSVVVTSRRLLELGNEREFPLSALPTPLPETAFEDVSGFPSVQMFVERAQQVQPEFSLGIDNAPLIAELCTRLEGVPLSLALAASRLQVMSPGEILDGLDERLNLLTTRRRDLPERHRSLRASFEWSFDLLPVPSRSVFAEMSVFRGGCSLAAIQAVCTGEDVLSSVEELIAHGLIEQASFGDARRFDMLESLRDFAAEHLDEDSATDMGRRHAMFFAALSDEQFEGMSTREAAKWVKVGEEERANFHIAMEWGLREEPRLALRIACNQGPFWHLKGMFREGVDWLERCIVADPEDSIQLGRAYNAIGMMLDRLGRRVEAREAFERSVALYEALGEPDRAVDPLNNLGILCLTMADYSAAEQNMTRSLAIFERTSDSRGIAMVLANLGNVACARGDFDTARKRLDRALDLNRAAGNRLWEANNLTSLAIAASYSGNPELGVELHLEGLSIKREVGYRMGIANSCIQLSESLRRIGRFPEAFERVREGLLLGIELDAMQVVAPALREVGMVLERLEQYGLAAEFWGAGEALAEKTMAGLHAMERPIYEEARARAHNVLGTAFDVRIGFGRSAPLPDLVAKLQGYCPPRTG